MNSEELELSLRTEFEEQLKNALAGMRQELAQLQDKVDTEFEKHKSQLSEVFRDFSARIETEKELDAGFTESVVEHLRLARDEGARITATAIAEAEAMREEVVPEEPRVGISDVRDAINDISSQTSQSSILKTLVSHAEKFTTRGAFFILKNEHFVGWRVFGSGQEEDDKTIREIFFPISAETVLGESVRSLSAVESSFGTYGGDSAYLEKLKFGQPERLFAIPLVARGRGVAVLYADGGEENESVNIEALETLVRVAGLTVEVTASSQSGNARYDAAPVQSYSNSAASVQPKEADTYAAAEDYRSDEDANQTAATEENYQPQTQFADSQPADYGSYSDTSEPAADRSYQSPSNDFSFQSGYESEAVPQNFATDDYPVEVIQEQSENEAPEFQSVYPETGSESYQSAFETASTEDFLMPSLKDYQIEDSPYESGQVADSPQIQFEDSAAYDNSTFESPQFESPQFESAKTESYDSATQFIPQSDEVSFDKTEGYKSFEPETNKTNDFVAAPPETVGQTTATPPIKSRFSDRNVDLPIEVSEDERRLHNDARRFARLLVSEIKLYNEQKVKEGREARDLYERLREAIDRSREMYDKRVQPPVAAKFDYFHYELVSSLAEGEPAKLGTNYQGATV